MYASLYPEQVAGMVLVDAGHEEQLTRLPPEYIQVNQQQQRYLGVMALLARFGVLRSLGQSAGEQALPPHIRLLPADVQAIYVTLMSHPSYFEATLGELEGLEETCHQVSDLGDLGDLPLVVLTAENSMKVETLQAIGLPASLSRSEIYILGMKVETLQAIGLPADFPIAQIQQTWLELQDELASLSTDSTHLIAEGSGHAIHLDRPDLVVEAVERLLAP